LRPNASAGLPAIITSTKGDHRRLEWRYFQTTVHQVKRRFSKVYFRTILSRQKWHDTKENLEVDDVVLAVDSNCPRSQWPLGRIVETCPAEYGAVRSVLLRVNGHDLRRPIHKLCLIQLARENSPDCLGPVQMASEDTRLTSLGEPCTNTCQSRVQMNERSRVRVSARM